MIHNYNTTDTHASGVYPLAFFGSTESASYFADAPVRALAAFFEEKGLPAIKNEDREEQWYEDWIAYQKQHGLYASILSPAQYSRRDGCFDLLRYTRFLEVFAYCSPAHGYSLQVTFLGLFSILMGSNAELKQEAVDALEAGKLLAFGVSERDHGSDLLANEFVVTETDSGSLVANGAKFYIGNTDTSSIISILGRKTFDEQAGHHANRAPFLLIALRPNEASCFRSLGKIRTMGVRAANVGSFEVNNHPLPRNDVIASGRDAWDAVFGTVTLGKFFLGFGSIGICERAFEEAVAHMRKRVLYGTAVIAMPHIRANISHAYARLTAMKLYAYRALDYVHAASRLDRRYLLFCAVQKAKVSTEGLKVMALLQECMGARGFESETFFEMALRDVQLIPSLEGSMHINLGLALQFLPRYFNRPDPALADPPSLVGGETPSRENAYLLEARTGAMHSIGFRPSFEAYRALAAVPNAVLFAQQVEIFREVAACDDAAKLDLSDMQLSMALGQCFATIVYGQLVAENASRLGIPNEMISAVFASLVGDLSALALQLAAIPQVDDAKRGLLVQMVKVPQTRSADWDFVAEKYSSART